ncbi:DUF1998 domain-containing protein [Reyranella sp. CPCC 100927]|uniref:DUF1998 domain-containing protein n=1 Tax=Reyranella sp. CPCC 100927 TaxID=2599616 RepID=UPI0011B725C8|nr:DUF1998 domain-containing protein [Reyranella sp. CPCC 100927]TWT06136.1 DUF1998 domain-containing protein [Reyranella sp. CPCC 100927]
MSSSPIRRSQLIAPFGVGALFVTKEGISLIGAGLDHWFSNSGAIGDNFDATEFQIEEWRLQKQLEVDYFCVPPDYRRPNRGFSEKNTSLTVPFLRFPQWHFCQRCGKMVEYPLTERGKKICSCERRGLMVQMPVVAICDRGHIQDFPWNQWVHQSTEPGCVGQLEFGSTGVGGLRGLQITCKLCKARRNLDNILSAEPDGERTHLTSNLDKAREYRCQGMAPWLGNSVTHECGRPIRGALRSSTNIYYAQLASAIYLPRRGKTAEPGLVDLLSRPPILTLRQIVGPGLTTKQIRTSAKGGKLVADYSDAQIDEALAIVGGIDAGDGHQAVPEDDEHVAFRRREFEAFLSRRRDDELNVSPVAIERYEDDYSKFFSTISLVEKLRETRVLRGFARVFPENDMDNGAFQILMRAEAAGYGDRWLPAYIVHGEGIFLQLSEQALQVWETRAGVRRRAKPLIDRYLDIQQNRRLRNRPISPRFILVHTLAHLLINRLTFESGYSAAALRERLFVSQHASRPMAGILIYTAAGDSDGTMGGLVRLGKPGAFEPILRKALEEARWCGADPVCVEAGEVGGQGPDSCNIAACHNCALIPETACEEFNRFLDRGMVVGTISQPDLGFFSEI